jgi:hypothetical protein
MGLFSRKKKQKINNSLSTSKSFFWGDSSAGTHVNEMSAMQNAAVYACVRAISESIASLPLHIYQRKSNGSVIIHNHHLYNLLHNSPNLEMTAFVFIETLMGHLLIYGNAYAQIIRDGSGRVTGLYPLLPNKMNVHRGENGELYYTYFGRRIGVLEEEAFVIGTGTDQPTGIFTANGGEVGVTATGTTVTVDNLIDLVYSLKSPYRKNAVFLMKDITVSGIRKLKDSNGQYLWQPSVTAGTPDTILGRPIYTSA